MTLPVTNERNIIVLDLHSPPHKRGIIDGCSLLVIMHIRRSIRDPWSNLVKVQIKWHIGLASD